MLERKTVLKKVLLGNQETVKRQLYVPGIKSGFNLASMTGTGQC